MGGNKGRKLEYLMADAQQLGKKKVVTYGGLQSNHVRMTAAGCAALGLEAHLFFFQRRPNKLEGNLLLDRLFGAKLHFIPTGAGGDGSMTIETTNRLVRLVSLAFAGPGAYFIPVGGHNITGCLGYVRAALELGEQIAELGLTGGRITVITACGTGGTLAGLLAGFKLLDLPVNLLGIDVGKLWKAFPASIAKMATELCQALDLERIIQPGEVPLIEGKYAGRGYAVFDERVTDAIELLARSEGILLDPVYTGKAFGGLLDLIRQGQFGRQEHVIFLHTGGTPGLWAYADEFRI
jgi:1-aminocyclopropane-1-carboxylate deaminase/D-cysteine desulfhydrase-like pyridoxal-dependent ACC family enzyme